MTQPNKYKNAYFLVIIFLLIASLFLNIYLFNNWTELKKDYHNFADYHYRVHSYLRYLKVIKLDRQSHIFYKTSEYLNRVNNDLLTTNEVNFYLSGVKEFSQNDILSGVSEIVFEDNLELKNILLRITEATILPIIGTPLNEISRDDLGVLIKSYLDLASLLNRNNKEDSLTYYILKNDLDNPELKQVLAKIDSILSIIKDKTMGR